MGESAAETVKEIEQVRGDLDGKVRELEDRLPSPAVWVKRIVGVAVGGGVGSSVFWFAFRRLRNRKKKDGTVADHAHVNVIELSLPRIDESTRPWIIGAGAAWLVIRMAQVRQARRTNRLLAQRAV